MSVREAAERWKRKNAGDPIYENLPSVDPLLDCVELADAFAAIADLITPEVREASCRWSADEYGFNHYLVRKDMETLIAFALAVIERVGNG